MTNIVNIAKSTDTRLAELADSIGGYASKVIEGAWSIGAALNEARELLGEDQAFGQWRKANVTDRYDISPRTQRVFQLIARTYTLDQLPRFLGITGLADVAALPELQQTEALAYLREAAEDGKKVPLSTVTQVVRLAQKGATAREMGERYNPDAIPETREVEPIERQAPVREAPVVIDGETGEVERQPQVQGPPARRPGVDPAADWAKTVVARIRRENGHRRDFLGALKAELSAAGMLEVVEGTVSVVDQGRKARLVVTK